MSLLGLQTAVAAIIRNPRARYDWKPDVFLAAFELTIPERRTVEKLSRHEELNKYGQDQANGRLEVALNHLDRVPKFVPDRVLKNIWMDLYEPTAIYTASDLKGNFDSSLAFLKFLRESKDAKKRLRRSAPFFISDIASFEIAELELSRPLLNDPPLRAKSTINNSHFRVVDLEFDIPGWLAKPDQEDISEFERPVSIAFVKQAGILFPKIFEITPEFKSFLLGEIGVGEPVEASAEMKSDLIKMGLIV